MRVTVDDLVNKVLEIDNTPIAQGTFSIDQIVSYLDIELHNTIVPVVKKCNEEYFINTLTVPVNPDVRYITIPDTAAGFAVRDVYLYDTNNTIIGKLNRVNPDQIPYMFGAFSVNGGGGFPSRSGQQYYIENNNIVFWPQLQQNFVARVRYFKAPNHLSVIAKAGGQVTGKLAGNQLQLDNVPLTWTTFSGVNALTIDATTPDSPYNFKMYPADNNANNGIAIGLPGSPVIKAPVINVSPGFIIEVDPATWAAVDTGDWIWENQKCGFVQSLPYEALELICMRASMRILKAQGDLQNLNISAQLYGALQDDFVHLITPKVQNMPQKVWNSAKLVGSRAQGRWIPRF